MLTAPAAAAEPVSAEVQVAAPAPPLPIATYALHPLEIEVAGDRYVQVGHDVDVDALRVRFPCAKAGEADGPGRARDRPAGVIVTTLDIHRHI